jgi:sugar/nucleoside kinase (ribokinase family)
VASLSCRIFHLGYLLLLDGMDQPHAEHGTVAAAFLNSLQRRGIKTSVDVVSEESDRFNTLVPPALRHVDYLILNEIEVSRVAQMAVRGGAGDLDGSALRDAVERLHSFGRMQLVAVHMPEGVYVRDNAGKRFSQGALEVPDGFIRGKVGAGDAFCAGMLYGLHEGWPHARAARLGTCCATACISDPTASGGVVPVDEALDLARRFPEGEPPVCV